MSEVYEYPLAAIIAALLAMTVSLLTIWATVRRERRESKRARKEAVESLRAELKEYVNLKVNKNGEIVDWIRRLEKRIDEM